MEKIQPIGAGVAVMLSLLACGEQGTHDEARDPVAESAAQLELAACGVPGFVAGTAYSAGDRVQVDGSLYECKPWPFSGWCSVGGAFAPGAGWASDQAWTRVGDCAGDDGSSDDGSTDGGDDGSTDGGDDGSSDGGDDGSSDGGDDGSSDDGASDDGSSDDGASDDGDAEWRQARLTWYTSYPDPNSEECWEFNGCAYAGYFAAWPNEQKSEQWVSEHNLVAVHERDFDKYVFKTLRIRSGNHEIEAMVVDMCADSDCNGCCTRNAAATGFLLDLESYTAERFGVYDANAVDWTCLDCD